MKNKLKLILFSTLLANSLLSQIIYDTIQPFSYGKDSWVRSFYPTNNYGNLGYFAVRQVTGVSSAYTERAFIEIDLTSIPANAIIVDATLKLYRYSGFTTPMSLEVNKVIESWQESTITWANAPDVTNVDMITQSVSTTNNIFHEIDVTDHVQEFVNYPHLNNGWRLKCQNESTTNGSFYRSSEFMTTPSHRPLLEISYVLPIEISLSSITHADDPNSSNGSISITADKGNGTYTYQWIDGATGSDMSGETSSTIDDLSPGWYGVKVTDGLGNISYLAFIVGAECGEVEIEFRPDGRFVDVTRVTTGFQSYTVVLDDVNLANATEIRAEKRVGIGTNFYDESLFKNLLIIPNNIHLISAFQFYKGSYHLYSSGNQTRLENITEAWVEDVVTWNTRPSYGSVITTIPSSTSTHQDVTLDLTSLYEDFQDGTAINYGQSFVLDYSGYPSSTTNRRMRYRNSNSTTPSERPKLTLKVGELCFEGYAHVKRTLDAAYTRTRKGVLKFQFDERYEQPVLENLVYTIYDENRQVVSVLENIPIEFSDNRYDLDLTSEGLTQDKIYTLEIAISKNEKRYLKFKYTL